MTSNTSKWQATHKFLLFFMILTVFHEFLPFFTNLSWQAINLWKIGEICEKTVKIMKNRRNLWKNCQNQRNSWKNTFLGQTRRNLSPQQSNKLKNLRKSQKSQKSQKISNNLKNLKKSQNLRKSQKISKISKILENLKNLRKSQKISKILGCFGMFWPGRAGPGWPGDNTTIL